MSFDTAEVVMQKLIALATEKGDGAFTIRIIARRGSSVVPTALVMFHQGTIAQLANIESWLARIVGGGEYTVAVNHASDLGKRHTFSMSLAGQPFPQVMLSAVQAPDWSGPTDVANAAPAQPESMPTTPSPFNPTFAQPGYPALRPQPMQQPQPFAQQVMPAGAQAFQAMPADAGAQLLTVQREAALAKGELDRRQAEMDKREIEDRMRREAHDRETKLRSEMAAQMESVKALFTSQQKPVEAKTDPLAAIAALAAAFAPIANAMIVSSNDMKRLQIEMGQKQAELAASTARDIAAAQAKAAESNTAMMLKLMEKPGQSPELMMMLDLQKSHAEGNSAMMGQIVNAMGTVSKMSIGMIETIADLTAPPEGSPVADAIKDTVKALGTLMNGADKGARAAVNQQTPAKPGVPAKPALPPGAPAQQGPTQEQIAAAQQRAAIVNQQAQQQQEAHAAAIAQQAQVPTPPANVVQFPQPVPAAPAPAPVPEIEMPDGFAGIETKSTVDELENLIRTHHEPVEAVAQYLLDNLKDPAMRGALAKHQGDPNSLLAEKFGLIWLSDTNNQAYVERLSIALEDMAEAQGALAPEEGDDANGADDAEPPANELIDTSTVPAQVQPS